MDFVGEYAANIRARLEASGYTVPNGLDRSAVCRLHLNLLRRRVPPVPRKVHIASEFSCPQELKPGLDLVLGKIESGQDLKPHLSRSFAKLEYHDMLLNDWGIHHLHLGTTLDPDGYVSRPKFGESLLFVRFTWDAAYLIAVLPHGSWARQDFVRILHRNWPASIAVYRLDGVVGLAEPITDEEIAEARNIKIDGQKKRAALTHFVEVEPGVVYAPIGGGSSYSQMSCDAVSECDRIFDALREYEHLVRQEVSGLVAEAKSRGLNVGDQLSFKLRRLGSAVVAIEESTMAVIGLPGRAI